MGWIGRPMCSIEHFNWSTSRRGVAPIRDNVVYINHSDIKWHGRDFGVEFIVLEVVVIVGKKE
jgi:hypothetical protein